MTFVRTVLGDIDPADLGVTYAHEHLVIDGGRAVELVPDFLLADVDGWRGAGGGPAPGLRTVGRHDAVRRRRNPTKLAELSRRTGVHLVAATGPPSRALLRPAHWSLASTVDELAERFVADIEDGIDADDYRGPVARRTAHRAGVIKVAGSDGGPSARIAASSWRGPRPPANGVPILTHCEGGTGALEQVRVLTAPASTAEHVALSHVDKVVDRAYHRDSFERGVRRVRPGVPLGRPAERHPPAARVGRRGRPRRLGRAGDGRRPAGLLPRLRWRARPRPCCSTVRRGYGRPRARRRQSAISCSSTTPPERSRSRRPIAGDHDDRGLLTSVVGSHARPVWFARRSPRPRGASTARRTSPRSSTTLWTSRSATRRTAGIDVVTRRRDAPGRLLHGRVLPPSDGRSALSRRTAGSASARTTSTTGSRSLRRSPPRRPRRGRRIPHAPSSGRPAVEGDPARAVHAVRPPGHGPGRGLRHPLAAAEAFVGILRAELGASSRRRRRSSRSTSRRRDPPDAPADFAALFNAAIEPVLGRVRLGAHLCFGNYLGRPLAPRSYRPMLQAMLGFHVDELVLEFANRELSEIEPPEDVADRTRRRRGRHRREELLRRDRRRGRPADRRDPRCRGATGAADPRPRLRLQPDRPPPATRAKLGALVAGRDLVLPAGAAEPPTRHHPEEAHR